MTRAASPLLEQCPHSRAVLVALGLALTLGLEGCSGPSADLDVGVVQDTGTPLDAWRVGALPTCAVAHLEGGDCSYPSCSPACAMPADCAFSVSVRWHASGGCGGVSSYEGCVCASGRTQCPDYPGGPLGALIDRWECFDGGPRTDAGAADAGPSAPDGGGAG
jgi:hypothetical protein